MEEGKTTVIKISDSDKLFEMISCNPWRESCVRLCSKPGQFIRVYDTVLMPDSVYKSIRISGDTTVRDVIDIVLACCNSSLTQDKLCLVETHQDNTHTEQARQDTTLMAGHMGIIKRVMDSEECLLGVTTLWTGNAEQHKLVLELKAELVSYIQDCTKGNFPQNLRPKLSNSLSPNLTKRGSQISLDSGYSGQSA